GLLAGLWSASRRGLRDGLSPEAVAGLGPWLVGGAFIGARLLYVISYWREEFAGEPIWKIFTMRSGLVFYGGFIGACLGGLIYVRWNKLPVWKLADAIAPSIALGHAFGRLGCLM